MPKIIKLTQSRVALVDDEDYECLTKMGNWYSYKRRPGLLYAAKSRKKLDPEKPKIIHMHRIIMNAKPRVFVDHINGNGLDNRKINLRLCSNAQNVSNQKRRKRLWGKYKGTSFFKSSKRWHARIGVNNKSIHLGCYLLEIEAARAYDEAAIKYHGDFARLNFPLVIQNHG